MATDVTEVLDGEVLDPETTPGDLVRMERMKVAIRMRADGADYQEIADHLHVANATARKLVKDAFRNAYQESVDELRDTQNLQIDRMMAAILPECYRGNFRAIDRAVLLMERKSRLNGMDKNVDNDTRELRVALFNKLREVLPEELFKQAMQALSSGG